MLTQSLQNIAGAVVRLGVSVATIPLLLRFLGVAETGLWFWAQAVIGVFTAVEAALATTATVFLARDRDPPAVAPRLTIILASVLALSLALGLVLWLSAGPLAALAGDLEGDQRRQLVDALEMAAVVVLARLLQTPFTSMQHARHRFGAWNLLQTAQTAATSIGVVVLATRGGQLAVLVGWQALMALVFLAAHAGVASRMWTLTRWRPVWSGPHFREMRRYAADAAMSTLGAVLFSHADRLLVGPLLGAAQLGVYGSLTAMVAQINTLSGTAAHPLLPRASELASQPPGAAPAMVAPPLRLSVALALALSLALMTLGPTLMRLLVPRWDVVGDDTALQLLAAIYGLYSLNAAGYFLLQGLGLIRLTGVVVLASGLASLLAIALGAHVLGLRGAVLGNACYIATFVLVVLAMRQLGIPARRWFRWVSVPLLVFVPASM